MAASKRPVWTKRATISTADALPVRRERERGGERRLTVVPLHRVPCVVAWRTGDGGRGRVVLGEGETAAGQDVLFLQVLQFQDVHLAFDGCGRRVIKL